MAVYFAFRVASPLPRDFPPACRESGAWYDLEEAEPLMIRDKRKIMDGLLTKQPEKSGKKRQVLIASRW